MRYEEPLNIIVITDHVEIEQAMIGGEDQTRGEPVPTLIESPPERTGAGSVMSMRIAEGLADRLDQFSDLLSLLLRETAQRGEQAGIKLNL